MTSPERPRSGKPVPGPRPRVLLIVGSGRSGSTLFERALGGVPGVAALGEVVHLWERAVRDDELCSCGRAFRACPFWAAVGERAFGGWDRVPTEKLVEARRAVIRTRRVPALLAASPSPTWRTQRDLLVAHFDAVLAAAQQESGARLLVDSSKMPAYAAALMRADVDLSCVEVVRDPRGVAYSLHKAVLRPESADQADLMHRTGAAEAALWWSAFDLVSTAMRRLGRVRFTTLRYEDFIADPAGSVRRVLGFAGVPVGAADLTHVDRDRIVLGTDHQVAGNPVRFRTGELRIRPDEAWRSQLPARDRRTVELLTAGLRRRHGYR